MSCAANTFDCFRLCIGKKVVGVLQDAMPPSRRDLAAGTKTLVFEDGSGFTFAPNGSYWLEDPKDIARAVRNREVELRQTEREIKDVLDLAATLA